MDKTKKKWKINKKKTRGIFYFMYMRNRKDQEEDQPKAKDDRGTRMSSVIDQEKGGGRGDVDGERIG